MRWLLVSRQHHPSHGGIGTYVQRFCRAAHAAGWHVELVTLPGDQSPPCAHVHTIRTPDTEPAFEARIDRLRRMHRIRPYRYALWSTAVAKRLLSMRGDFDAVEFVDCQAEGLASLGCRAVRDRFAAAKFIVHAHTPMFVEERINGADKLLFGRSIYHDWERQALGLADGAIATSQVLAKAIDTLEPAAVIPYPIENDWLAATTPREERVLLIGTVQPRKGVDTWVRSLNTVLRQRPRATAMVIGADTPTAPDGRSMVSHVSRLLDPSVSDRFQWMASMPHEQVRSLMAGSALVVVPSVLESFSFAAAEALLAGTPVIVSDQTGIAEHVRSLHAVRVGDVEAWAQAQISALSDTRAAIDNAHECRREMLDSCSPTRVLAARETLVEQMRTGPRDQALAVTQTGDSLVEMARFIAQVDADESAASQPAFASSVRS